jgi:ABC-type sugar transport system substrate-binding protein
VNVARYRAHIATTGLAAFLAVSGLAACSSSGSSSAPAAPASTGPAAAANATSPAAASSNAGITIAYAQYSESVPFNVAEVDGVEQEAKALGVKLTIENANNSPTTQQSQMQTLLLQNIKGLLLTPADVVAVGPEVAKYNQANIPVVAIAATPSTGKIYTEVGADATQIGNMEGKEAIALLKARYGTAKGNIVYGGGDPSVDVTAQERNGLNAALQPYPDVHLIASFAGNWSESDSYTAMMAVLAAHPAAGSTPSIDVAIGADDPIADGILEAAQKAGRLGTAGSASRMLIIGADGSAQGVQGVENGTFAADIGNQPNVMGELAVEQLVNAIKGVQSKGNVTVPLVTLTPQNISTTPVWGKNS